MIRRLALFDIDGTLLTTSGRAVEAMLATIAEVYEAAPEHDGYLMDGKTELRIVHELLASAGRSREQVERGLPEFWGRYAAALERRVDPASTTVYRGVKELIARLSQRDDVAMGLLTGNCEAGARIKLASAGLDGAFAFGAYGEAHEAREELPAVALDAAERYVGRRLSGKHAAVLGDTPNDIRCARPQGLRTIAVATGRYDAAALAAHDPDYLFPDFRDGDAVIAAIMAD